jgi:hypothetical protein
VWEDTLAHLIQNGVYNYASREVQHPQRFLLKAFSLFNVLLAHLNCHVRLRRATGEWSQDLGSDLSGLGDHPKAAIGYHFKSGHRETA